ncbi:unnamed protein product [Didymodactylos carnosus]|uniref:TatD n=1 Tax=Didymodactylos carnosus TaxID=1234261 RepID=A0A813UWC4_9BILA|nr:unnamed protein product [Didymodactylos carnosus]CAF1186644.1 unnamed protein product [Didymodactylos carnosus]CAF3616169.1 unnamed protein product [Didymodactylos carnosus]CAF3997758.1 unnamed protein product [Didymodactylos carnosus]
MVGAVSEERVKPTVKKDSLSYSWLVKVAKEHALTLNLKQEEKQQQISQSTRCNSDASVKEHTQPESPDETRQQSAVECTTDQNTYFESVKPNNIKKHQTVDSTSQHDQQTPEQTKCNTEISLASDVANSSIKETQYEEYSQVSPMSFFDHSSSSNNIYPQKHEGSFTEKKRKQNGNKRQHNILNIHSCPTMFEDQDRLWEGMLPSTKQISQNMPQANYYHSTSRTILVRPLDKQHSNMENGGVRDVLFNSNNGNQQSHNSHNPNNYQKSTRKNIILNGKTHVQQSSNFYDDNRQRQDYSQQPPSRAVLSNEKHLRSPRKNAQITANESNERTFFSTPPLSLHDEKSHYTFEKVPQFYQNRFPKHPSSNINQDDINSLQYLIESDVKVEEIPVNHHSQPPKTRTTSTSSGSGDEERFTNDSIVFTNSSYNEDHSEKNERTDILNSSSSSPHQISFEKNQTNEHQVQQFQSFDSKSKPQEKGIPVMTVQTDVVVQSSSQKKPSRAPADIEWRQASDHCQQQQQQRLSHLSLYNQDPLPRFERSPIEKKEHDLVQHHQQDILPKTYTRLPHSLRLQDKRYQTQTATSQKQIQPLFQINKSQTNSSQTGSVFSKYSTKNNHNHINHSTSNHSQQTKDCQPKFDHSEHQENSRPPRFREPGCCDEPSSSPNDFSDSTGNDGVLRTCNEQRDGMKISIKQKMIEIEERMKKNGLISSLVDTHCHFDLLFDRLSINKITVTDYFDKEYKDLYPSNLKFEKAIQVYWRPNHLTRDNWDHYSKYLDDSRVYGTCGVHPHWSNKWQPSCADDIERCLKHPKVLGIGECGLDFGPKNNCDEKDQRRAFIAQLQIAAKFSKPLVIHSRGAYELTFNLMKKYLPKNHKIHLHCFCGRLEDANMFINYFTELKLGFTPLISTNRGADIRAVIKDLDLNRLLSETDSPYFVPEELSGIKYAHPIFVYNVIEVIAQEKQLSIEDVAQQLRENVRVVYGI